MISQKPIIGVLMPGDMGHGIAKVLVENNFKVLTFLKGRSKRTLKLANEARVINIDNFEYFLNEVRSYAEFVRSSPPANKNEKVLIPGDKEISTYKDRLANGLPVAPIVWQNIKQTAKELNIPNLDRFNSAINKT